MEGLIIFFIPGILLTSFSLVFVAIRLCKSIKRDISDIRKEFKK